MQSFTIPIMKPQALLELLTFKIFIEQQNKFATQLGISPQQLIDQINDRF